MASISDGIVAKSPARIPAWKRLGLKLKYAKETADEPLQCQPDPRAAPAIDGTNGDSRENVAEPSEDVRPSKKRKTSSESPSPERISAKPASYASAATDTLRTAQAGDEDVPAGKSQDGEQLSPPPRTASPPPVPRRKSVTFTEDTKREDGISAKILFDQPISTDPFSAVAESTESQLQPSKKTKKQRKSGPKASTEETADVGPPQFLQYLERFENDRHNWKFNKNHQNNLLKHIFDVRLIPEKYNAAVLEYLKGLKGAALRTRLIESATAILQTFAEEEGSGEDIAAMESAQARRDAYGAALKRQLERIERVGQNEYDEQQLEDMGRETQSAKRAEDMLRLLLEQELRDGPTQSSTPSSTAGPGEDSSASVITINSGTSGLSSQPQRKKRKTRTNTTSSDDSDSSGSENDREYSGPATTRQTIQRTPSSARSYDAPKKPPVPLEKLATGKKTIFDEELLDTMFPKSKSFSATTEKRERDDESESSSSSSSSESSESSDSDSE